MYNESTKVKLGVFKELRRRLNGKCGSNCPFPIRIGRGNRGEIKLISPEKFLSIQNYYCDICKKEFNFLSCKHKYFLLGDETDCPCLRKPNPEELFLRLDEYIEELEENLSKEYSS